MSKKLRKKDSPRTRELPLDMADECDVAEPPLAEVSADARHTFRPSSRRLPGPHMPGARASSQMLLEMLDDVHLVGELRHPVPTFQDVLVFLRAGARRALERSLMALRDAHVGSPDDVRRSRAWKVFFLLTPCMLLVRAKLKGAAGRRELLQRIQSHGQGQWQALLADARDASCWPQKSRDTRDAEAAAVHRRELACAKVRRGEPSRDRHLFTAAELAPGNEVTLAASTDASKRPQIKRPPQAREPIPAE